MELGFRTESEQRTAKIVGFKVATRILGTTTNQSLPWKFYGKQKERKRAAPRKSSLNTVYSEDLQNKKRRFNSKRQLGRIKKKLILQQKEYFLISYLFQGPQVLVQRLGWSTDTIQGSAWPRHWVGHCQGWSRKPGNKNLSHLFGGEGKPKRVKINPTKMM